MAQAKQKVVDYPEDDALNIYTDGSMLPGPRRGGTGVAFILIAVVVRAGGVVLLPHPGEDEHLVVHREPEEEGENDHRQLGRDRSLSGDAPDSFRAVAVLPGEAQDAPGGDDGTLRSTALAGRRSERKARARSR
jgi:hypothetical protein